MYELIVRMGELLGCTYGDFFRQILAKSLPGTSYKVQVLKIFPLKLGFVANMNVGVSCSSKQQEGCNLQALVLSRHVDHI